MGNRSCHCTVAAILAGIALTGAAASAQNPEPACSVGVSNLIGYGGPRKINVPYIATAKTTFEQRLPDGNSVRGYIYTHQARDSAGRTMSEMAQGCRLDENGVPQPQLSVSVFDPATNTSLFWQVGINTDKVARISYHLKTPRKTLTPDELAARRKASESQQPPSSEFKSEDLGKRAIAGVVAHGSRTTRTIPAGEEGNELPLVTITETWNSKELGLVVLGIKDDPRRGRITYEIEELSRTEPDRSVFTPPEGYRIEDRAPLTASQSQP
jgi:hypothetical protein